MKYILQFYKEEKYTHLRILIFLEKKLIVIFGQFSRKFMKLILYQKIFGGICSKIL